MSATMTGVTGEDREDLDRDENRRVRQRSIRLLGSLVRPVRRTFVLSALAVVLSTAMRASGPALVAFGIDVGLPAVLERRDWWPIGFTVAAYLTLGIGGALLTAWYTVLSARVGQAILFDLRKRVFRHTQRLSLEFHERYTSGRIIARQTSDLDSLHDLLSDGINELTQAVLYMTFVAIAIFTVDWVSGLILLVALIPVGFLSRWFQRTSQRMFRRTRSASAKVIVHFVETMTGIRAVQAFRKERRNRQEFAGLVEDYRDANAKAISTFGIYEPGLVLIGNVALGVVLLVGGFRVAGGALEVGALLAALLYTRSFFQPAQDIAMFYNGYQSAEAALEKISGVLEEEPTVPDPARPVALPRARGEVRFDHVRFQYTPDAV